MDASNTFQVSPQDLAASSASILPTEISVDGSTSMASSTLASVSTADCSVHKCSKCKCKRPIKAFEDKLGKKFKTCNNCRGFKDKKKIIINPEHAKESNNDQNSQGQEQIITDSECADELNNYQLDDQPITVEDFLDDYSEKCAYMEYEQESGEGSTGLNNTWILDFLSNSKDVKDLAEQIKEWIEEIDDYQWMYVYIIQLKYNLCFIIY